MSDAETKVQAEVAMIGATAPDFTLKDGAGQDWRLSDRRGQTVVLLFYPGDETPVGLLKAPSRETRATH